MGITFYNKLQGESATLTSLKLDDTNASNYLTLDWSENDTSDRTLGLAVGSGNRTLTLNENLTIGDGNAGTVTFTGASKTLSVEDTAVVSQDYSSNASPSFAGVSLGTGELTAGSVNRASGSLTLEVGGDAQVTATTALVTVAHDLCINETAYYDAVQTATGDGATTIDWGLGNIMKFTFGAANETFTFTAPGGPCHLTLILTQDGTGSRTATWPSGTPDVKWPSNGTAPTLSTGVADVDIVSFFYDGTNYYGQAGLDFA